MLKGELPKGDGLIIDGRPDPRKILLISGVIRYCPQCSDFEVTNIKEEKTDRGTVETWTCNNGHKRTFRTT